MVRTISVLLFLALHSTFVSSISNRAIKRSIGQTDSAVEKVCSVEQYSNLVYLNLHVLPAEKSADKSRGLEPKPDSDKRSCACGQEKLVPSKYLFL